MENAETLQPGASGVIAVKSIQGWIVFVTGVHEEAQEEDIRDAFSDYGQVKNIQLDTDRQSGYVKGYALVEYDTKSEAQAAIDSLNGTELLSRTIHVDWAFQKGPLRSIKHPSS